MAAALAGLALGLLAFVPGWLHHDRILLGEGPRRVYIVLSAWENVAVPFLAAGVVLVVVGSVAPMVWIRRVPEPDRWRAARWTAGALLAGLALMVGSVPPVSQAGHASQVSVWPSWAVGVGIGLALVSTAVVLAHARPSRRLLAVATGMLLVLGAGTWGARQLQLDLVEGNGQSFSEGSYTRAASGEEPTETMTLQGGRFSVGTRWSGTYEPSGRVVSLVGDPACPAARGSYHVDKAASGTGIRWTLIVDTCAGGERAADLTTGVWERAP